LQTVIRLIVGLGNPGEEYTHTRHNAGAWFVEQLAAESSVKFLSENKFQGRVAAIQEAAHKCWLLLPNTFMNHSGQAVRAFSQFYQIAPEEILVAHDELDFPAGVVRLKQGGGHGGHNGLRDIIQNLQSDQFHRLRIGIGHPGNRNQVHDYVLNRPSKHDHTLILDAIQQALIVLPQFILGDTQKAIQQLHSIAS